MKIKNKKVSVLGISKIGVSAALLAEEHGAHIFLSDIKTEDKLLPQIKTLNERGISYETGGNTLKILESDLIIKSPGVWKNNPILLEAEDRGIPIMGEMEFANEFVRKDIEIIAVSGTNGKTTTCYLIEKILKTAGRNAHLIGHGGSPYSGELKNFKKGDIIVMELSCAELDDITNFKPHIAVITNIFPDHLDRFKTIENYVNVKKKLFKNQTKKDFAVVNSDNLYIRSFIKELNAKIITFKAYADNISAAEETCKLCNIRLEIIHDTIHNYKNLEHRMESAGVRKGITFINDSKSTNVWATIRALNLISAPVVLILGGRIKNNNFNKLKKEIREKVKLLITYGEMSKKILRELNGINVNCLSADLLDEAVKMAYNKANQGDTVLFSPACSCYVNEFNTSEERGERFKHIVNSVED